MTADLMQVPVVAAKMPQEYINGDQPFCFRVDGPDKCDVLADWTYEYLDDCHIVFYDCEQLHKRTIDENADYGTEDADGHSDWAMESQEDDFKAPEEDIAEYSKEGDFEESKEDKDEDAGEYDFEYSKEGNFEEPKEDKDEDAGEYDFEESEEYGNSEDSKWADFEKSEDQDHEESFAFPSVVTKAFNVARQLPASFGIPQSVQDALINDPNAPASLAAQFTDGADTPDFYDNLPQSQREMFLTERAPQMGTTTIIMTTAGPTTMTMTSAGATITTTMSVSSVTTTTATTVISTTMTPTTNESTTITPTTITSAPTITGFRYRGYDASCDNPNNNVTQSCMELAVNSQVANRFASIASDLSQAAANLTCSALSSAASTVSEDAASASALASAARSSLSCDQVESNMTDVNAKGVIDGINSSSTVSVPKLSAVFAVSFTVAVATLGLALYL